MKLSARILFLGLAATLPFVASLLYFVILSGHPVAQAVYSVTKIFTIVGPLCFYRWVLKEAPPPFRLYTNLPHEIRWGVLSGTCMVGAILLLYFATPLWHLAYDAAPRIRIKAESLGVLEHYVLFALFLSLFHSLIEEYFWRWFVYGELARILGASIRTHLLSAVAFSLHHVVVATQFFPPAYGVALGLSVGIGGAVWSYLFALRGTILGVWISHAIVDLGILGVGYTLLFS